MWPTPVINSDLVIFNHFYRTQLTLFVLFCMGWRSGRTHNHVYMYNTMLVNTSYVHDQYKHKTLYAHVNGMNYYPFNVHGYYDIYKFSGPF